MLFILSLVDRHRGCFHFQATINSAFMNIRVHVFGGLGFSVLSGV